MGDLIREIASSRGPIAQEGRLRPVDSPRVQRAGLIGGDGILHDEISQPSVDARGVRPPDGSHAAGSSNEFDSCQSIGLAAAAGHESQSTERALETLRKLAESTGVMPWEEWL